MMWIVILALRRPYTFVCMGERLVDNPIPGLINGTRVHAIIPPTPSDTGHAKRQITS